MNVNLYDNLLAAMVILLSSAIIVPLFSEKRKLAGLCNFILVAIAGGILLHISYVSIFIAPPQASRLIHLGALDLYFLVDSFSGFFIGIGLTFIGYIPNVTQSDETIFGLRFLMVGLPIVFIVLSGVIYKAFYKLNDEFQEKVVAKISQNTDAYYPGHKPHHHKIHPASL